MEGTLQKIVGRNLRQWRQDHGYSRESFADYVGAHRTYMGAVERGERNLTLQTLERIADFIEVEPLDLLRK